MLAVVRAKGYTATLERPRAAPVTGHRLSEEERARLDARTVSHGDAVRIADVLVEGKYTIVDYYADWCGPCLLLGRDLEQLLAERRDVALRKVDLVSWESAAAKQVTGDYGIRGIPYVRVYGPDAGFLGAVDGNDIAKVRALLGAPPGGGER